MAYGDFAFLLISSSIGNILGEKIQHLLVRMFYITSIYGDTNEGRQYAFRYRCHMMRIIRAAAIIISFVCYISISHNNNTVYIAVIGFYDRFKPCELFSVHS
ncbi:hypothetical protein D3C80_1795180 [compost metagenome]